MNKKIQSTNNTILQRLGADFNLMFIELIKVTKTKVISSEFPLLYLGLWVIISWGIHKIIEFDYNNILIITWFLLLAVSLIIYLVRVKLNVKIKGLMFLLSFMIGIGLFWKMKNFVEFIGKDSIKGFYIEYYNYSYLDEDGFLVNDIDYRYVTDSLTGDVIIFTIKFMFYPFIISVIYLRWKFIEKSNKKLLNIN